MGVHFSVGTPLSGVNRALLSRVEVIHVPQPSPDDFPAIAAGTRDELARQHHVAPRLLPPFTGEDIELLQAHCRSARDVRRLAEEIMTCRIAAEHRSLARN